MRDARGLAYSLVLIAILGGGCGGPDARRTAFTRDLVRLETDAAVGRFGDALSLSSDLLERAVGARESCPVLVSRARALAGLDRSGEALGTYRRIAAECGRVPQESASAMLHLGRWVSASATWAQAALPVFEALVRTFPDESSARQAVAWIRDLLLPESGAAATADRLVALAAQVRPGGRVAANLLFEAGFLLRERGDGGADLERALALFDRVVAEHPNHGLSNDALMARADVLRRLGRFAGAVASLEALLARREWSFLIGSYEIDLYRQASALLPEVAQEAGESDVEVARRQREHLRRYPPRR